MEKLIPIIMKLQDAFNVINSASQIELPQLVVVGSQSTGKSSVLESIVGRDFLPRGQGIVTRCPLVLQLKNSNNKINSQAKQGQNKQIEEQKHGEEYGEFLHRKGERFYDFNKIRKEIQDQTARIAGADKNISDQPISLTIYSPNVVDLTLVDLPGMTKIPVKGQPHDIEDQIKRITYKFISQPNALILALTSANTDLANSDAIKLAREVDPQGDRTIGVVTKIDLMDQGTDALEVLQGKIYPLKLGYYGVKCRSQKQIDDNLSIKEAIECEREFFEKHPIYSSHSDQLGIQYLSRSLNKILCQHITRCIPSLSKQINELLNQKELELASLDSQNVGAQSSDKGPMVLNLINRFTNSYEDMIEGKFVKESAVDCLGGSRINYIFHSIFVKSIKEIDPFQYLTEADIQTAIKNAQALSPSLFVPEVAFEVLIRQQIARLLEPSLECAHRVYKELRDIVFRIELPEIARYQKLKYKICDVMEKVLDQCLTPTTEMIINLIEIENAHINTNHPDFVGSADTLLNLFQGEQEVQESDNFFSDQLKSHTLFDKQGRSKSPGNEKGKSPFEAPKSQVAQSSYIGKPNQQQDGRYQRNNNQEEQKQDPSRPSKGLFGWLKGSKPENDLLKSELIDEKDQEDQNIGGKLKQYQRGNSLGKLNKSNNQEKDDFEILARLQEYQLNDRSNLPQIILPQVPHKMRACQMQENPRVIMETIIIQNLIQSYFAIVKKNIADLVPKTIMAFLVNKSVSIAQSELVSDIYKMGSLDDLLIEDPLIAQTRTLRKKEVNALRTAQLCLNEASQNPLLKQIQRERFSTLSTSSLNYTSPFLTSNRFLFLESSLGHHPKLQLKFKGPEYVMDKDKTLKWLAQNMKTKRDVRYQIDFYSPEGQILDQETTLISDLLHDPYFTIKIDDEKEYNIICEKSFSYKNNKFRISNRERPFYDNLKLLGMKDLKAIEFSRFMSHFYDVTHNQKQYNHGELLATIREVISLMARQTKEERDMLEFQLSLLIEQRKQWEDQLEIIKFKSMKKAKRVQNFFVFTILSQYFLVQYATYVAFSWDIVEPVTCAMTLGDTVLGYTFWMWSQKPYTLSGLHEFFYERAKNKLIKRKKVDYDNYLKTDQAIEIIKGRIEELK